MYVDVVVDDDDVFVDGFGDELVVCVDVVWM